MIKKQKEITREPHEQTQQRVCELINKSANSLIKQLIMFISSLLFYYGFFLILCGIISVSLIGWKAKTALISGGTAGTIAITIGHFISQGSSIAQAAGLVVCFMLLVVFCWRSAKTLFTVLDFIPERHPDLKGKAIAFLIISLMAVVTLIVLLFQLAFRTAGK